MSGANVSAEQLRLFIERIERLEEEKKGIADDIKDVKSEAKSVGYDVATINAIIKLRKMDADRRREAEAMLDTYKAALGMLDGTPLGTWAVERLKRADTRPSSTEDATAPATPPAGGDPATQPDTAEETPPEPTMEDAARLGSEAAKEGKPVTANPFPARDRRRAAWDEAWCQALGTDGMDIPDALKPTPKPKKGGDGEPRGGEE